MPYSAGRIAHDADAHVMETPTWLGDHADPGVRHRIEPLRYPGGNELRQTGDPDEQSRDLGASFDRLRSLHASDDYRRDEADQIMARKNFAATGSFIAEDRPRALDLLGFSSQLVFNTFHNRRLRNWEHSGDLDLAYGAARAHNRAMVEFCDVDPRLLPTCYVPLVDFGLAWTRFGLGPRRPASPWSSMWAAPAISSTPTTSTTAFPCPPISTAEKRTSGRSTTWASPAPRPRLSPP